MSDIIWESKLDAVYDCRMTRLSEYSGELTVTEVHTGNLLLKEVFSLSFGALFGPDVDDVVLWQDRCVEAVDRKEAA